MSLVLAAGLGAVLTGRADAAVVRPFTLNFNEQLYGDFIELGNGNSGCPGPAAPTDPFGEPKATCPTAQARTYTAAGGINDSYYMTWTDVDSSAATFNSSTGTLTVPPGAGVEFARLNWSGDTGTIRLADGTVSPAPGCNTRQFLAGAGTAVLPAGTPESTSVRLAVGDGASTAVAPQVISRDALANVPSSQPQFYAAHADVTAQLQAAATGLPTTITVGNVWTPQGFGCYSGWSLVVVFAYDGPDPVYAPGKREIFLYDGHVRQSSVDPTTTVTLTGFRVSATPVRVGLTGYEGDFNIAGDQFSVNGVPQADPIGTSTTNFWVADADNQLQPAPANNMSVDAKVVETADIDLGDTSAQLSFSTAGDTYLAQNLVMSVPVPSISITKTVVGGPFRPGQQVPFVIEIVSPGGTQAVNVTVDDPLFADCDRDLGTLLPDVPVTYTCTGPAPGDDGVNTAIGTGEDAFGDPLTDSADAAFEVINPAIDLTKTADRPSYALGEVITFTIVVTNTGDTPLTSVAVTDPLVPSCTATRPLLAAGGSFTYTCTTTAPIPGDVNTATVTAVDLLDGTVTDTASAPAPTLGSVSGRVFADRNDNGVLDVADRDTGIGAATVTLAGTTAAGAPVSLTTTTAPDGGYTFAGLPAGTYLVAETQPTDFDDGRDTPGNDAVAEGDDAFTVTLAEGTVSVGNDFAELPTSSLTGAVFEDSNGNGVLDDGEPDLAGVTVTLTGTDSGGNPIVLTTTTAADGTYSFPRLRDGQYTVTETQPDGYLDGADTVGSAGGVLEAPDSVVTIPLLPRTDATGYHFGETLAASISGRVVDDAGTGIPGVTITLTGPLATPVVVLTDATGAYTFPGLVPGTYTVTETQPPAYGDGDDTLGSVGGDNSVDDVFGGIVIRSGVDATDYVFAETRGSLAGAVYQDTNGNGTRDDGEPGIPAVPVTLTGTDDLGGPVTLTTTTAEDGSYLFDHLLGGTYAVTETQPPGYLDGTDTAGTSGGTPQPPDTVDAIAIPPGDDATGYLFGELIGASLAGTVTDDGDNPIPGVTLALTGTDDLGDPVTLTTTTGDDGTWSFANLRPGSYTVTETQPPAYGDGADTAGSAGGTNSADDVISGITLAPGTTATGYRFAETRGSIAGTVYQDRNDNGTQNPGEPGIGGVTLTLTGTDALGRPVTLTTTTAPDGGYTFGGIVGGSYVIVETQPAGFADGQDTPGTAGGSTVSPDTVTGIALAGGQAATGYLFGELTGAITGTVFLDTDGDGAIDADETTRIPDVVVILLDGDGDELARTTTDADGGYLFPGLPAGTYTVRQEQPPGYGSTTPNQQNITLEPGGGGSVDFGERLGAIGDRVWSDTNHNAVQDEGEPGLPGVTLILMSAGEEKARTTTDADGAYTFADLPPGTYTVVIEPPDDLALVRPHVGENDALDSDFDQIALETGALVVKITDGTISQLDDVDAGLVDAVVDLTIGLTTDRPSAVVGDTVTFTATVSNAGTVPVAGASMKITVPAGLRIDSAAGDGWTCSVSGQIVNCLTEAPLLPGTGAPPVTLRTTATVPLATTTATAEVFPPEGTVEDDLTNNAATAPVAVIPVPTPPPPPPPPPPTPPLPGTGAPVGALTLTGLLLAALGSTALLATRRRGTPDH